MQKLKQIKQTKNYSSCILLYTTSSHGGWCDETFCEKDTDNFIDCLAGACSSLCKIATMSDSLYKYFFYLFSRYSGGRSQDLG